MNAAPATPWDGSAGAPLNLAFGGIALRQFVAGRDTRHLFDIRNHDTVRRFMPDPAPLHYAAHEAWVARHLVAGSNTLMFLVWMGDEAIGFALLKRVAPDTLEIGVLLRQAGQHATVAGQVAALMLHLCFSHFGFAYALTYVNHAHTRALALNRGLGLLEAPSDKAGEYCFRTPAAVVLDDPRYRRVLARIARSLRTA